MKVREELKRLTGPVRAVYGNPTSVRPRTRSLSSSKIKLQTYGLSWSSADAIISYINSF